MLHPPAPLAALLLATLAWAIAGCGGAAPSGAAKSYAPGATGVDQALADLDAAEAEIAGRFGPLASAAPQQPGWGAQQGYPQAQPGGAATSPYAQPPAAPPPPPAAAPAPEPLAAAPSEAPSDDEGDAEERAEREAEERCALACRALGSMRRAADHVCRAAGPDDARCLRARDRVTAADQRVRESCDECD